MLVLEKRRIYFAIELRLREISYVLYAGAHSRALMKQKSCAVGMRNAKLGNHLNMTQLFKKARLRFKWFLFAECMAQNKLNRHGLFGNKNRYQPEMR